MKENQIIEFLGNIETVIKRDLTALESESIQFIVGFHEAEPSVIAERVTAELDGDITHSQVYDLVSKYF